METPLIRMARQKAFEWHDEQMYGSLPYCFHLMDNVRELLAWNYDKENLVCSAYLHDTIEDTGKTRELISQMFNPKIGTIVWACSGEGKNRKEKKACMIQRLTDNPIAIPNKMVDRICNMKNSKANNPRMFAMYWGELPDYAEIFEKCDPAMYQAMLELGK